VRPFPPGPTGLIRRNRSVELGTLLRRGVSREVVTFATVGALNTVLDFALFYALLSIGPLNANVISTVVATTSSYLMTRYWTYRDRLGARAVHQEFLLFAFVNLVGLGIQELVLTLARYGLGFHEHGHSLALLQFKLVGVAFAVFFRFWACRQFVFPATAAADAALPATKLPATRLPAATDDERFAELTAPLDVEFALNAEFAELPEGVEVGVAGVEPGWARG
jgi:putative flippase GtrA